jgi:hypothetical protein
MPPWPASGLWFLASAGRDDDGAAKACHRPPPTAGLQADGCTQSKNSRRLSAAHAASPSAGAARSALLVSSPSCRRPFAAWLPNTARSGRDGLASPDPCRRSASASPTLDSRLLSIPGRRELRGGVSSARSALLLSRRPPGPPWPTEESTSVFHGASTQSLRTLPQTLSVHQLPAPSVQSFHPRRSRPPADVLRRFAARCANQKPHFLPASGIFR